MPESTQITYGEIITVLANSPGAMSVENIFHTLRPNPISPAATQEAKSTILHYLQMGQAAGVIGAVGNNTYFLIDPAYMEYATDSSDEGLWDNYYDSTDSEDMYLN